MRRHVWAPGRFRKPSSAAERLWGVGAGLCHAPESSCALQLKQAFTSQRTTGGCSEGKHLSFSAGPAPPGFSPGDVRGAECLLALQCSWSLVPLCNHSVVISRCEKAPGEVRKAKTCSYSAIPGLRWEDEAFLMGLFCSDWGNHSELAEVWEQLETPF